MRRAIPFWGRRLLATTAQGTLADGASEKASGSVCISITDKAGRGLFATRDIAASELIHSVDPVVSHPSLKVLNKVCYFCLRHRTVKTFPEVLGVELNSCGVAPPAFCSSHCALSAKGFYAIERKADWSDLIRYCRDSDLKFPLIARRLACMVAAKQVPANALDFLCYARLPNGIPSSWVHESQLLRQALSKEGLLEATAFLTEEWYAGVMSRLHLNIFRVELINAGNVALEEAASASVLGEGGVGSAVYLLPSLYNHSCDPNVNVSWVDNATATFHTTRPVKAGDELYICYMDASMSRDQRTEFLQESYGFTCQCHRCVMGDDFY